MLDIYDYEPFKVYSSKDANAPALSKAKGSFGVVLKACLITGYGTKTPPSGWTMPFEDANNGVRTFKSTAVLSTRCEYKVFNDTTSRFSMSAKSDGATTAFANITRSKQMYNVTGNQDWIVIANDKSCYVLLQTDANEPFFAVLFFGNAYTTGNQKHISAMWGLNTPVYDEYNYSIHHMSLLTSTDTLYKERFFANSESKAITGENIFYPSIFLGSKPERVFLPGYVVNAGSVPPVSTEPYTALSDVTGDVLFFTTAWGIINSQFGVATKAVL